MEYYRHHKDQLAEAVLVCLKQRMSSQHLDLLTHILTVLATHGWDRNGDVSFSDAAVTAFSTRFVNPLQKAGIDTSVLLDEWKDMAGYSKQYLNLVQESYQVIWWKLFNASCSSKWSNELGPVELLFCMPIINGHVERVFSSLKRIKTDLRSSLSEDHLDDLLKISVDGPLHQNWDSISAVRLWRKDKQRRQVGDRQNSKSW